VPDPERLVTGTTATDPAASHPDGHHDPMGLEVEARRAELVVLDPAMSAAEAFTRVADECVEHWRTNESSLRTTRSVRHLHQTRVGIRRLRSAFSLFGPVIRQVPGAPLVAHRLRALALPFGPARDLDVLLTGPLGERLDDTQRARLTEHRETAYDAVLAILHSPEWASVRSDLDALLGSSSAWPDGGPVRDLARAALEKRSRRVVGTLDRLPAMTPADRHRVRIEAKKLRYGCEFFSALFPADQPRVVVDDEGTELVGPLAHAWLVEDVQTALGALNDHATADALLHRVGGSAPAVDADALLEEGIAAVARLVAVVPFWR
jgi:CHAD domain-containing protein